MPETTTLLLAAIVLSAFFSGTEVAIVSTSKLKAKQLYEENKPNSKYLLRLKEKPNESLITILIGNNLMNVAASALATQLSLQLFQDSAIAIATGAMTFILLTFGEITPKTLAMKYSESISLMVSPIIYYMMIILSPFVSFFTGISKLVNKIGPKLENPLVTERDIKYLARIGEKEGQIKQREKEIIEKAFRLDDIALKQIMTPKKEVFALEWNTPVTKSLPRITKEKYSRIPVYEKNIDSIRGLIHVNDILLVLKNGKDKKLKSIISPILSFNPRTKADKAFKEMQTKNTHMAVVKEKNETIGIITMEDVLEQLVGEIFDETDYSQELVKQTAKNEYNVKGITYLRTLNKTLHASFPVQKEFTTIQKYLKEKNKPVKKGTTYTLKEHNLKITITKTDGSKIEELKIKKWK